MGLSIAIEAEYVPNLRGPSSLSEARVDSMAFEVVSEANHEQSLQVSRRTAHNNETLTIQPCRRLLGI